MFSKLILLKKMYVRYVLTRIILGLFLVFHLVFLRCSDILFAVESLWP